MVLIPIVAGIIGVGQTYLANIVGLRVMQDLRESLYTHLQMMPLRFFTQTRTGEIQSRLANDVGGVQSVVTDTASSILANVVVIVSTVIAMLIISVPLTILSLALTPLFLWLTIKVGRARREVATSTQRTMADMSTVTEETLSVSGILLSKAFGRQEHEIAPVPHRERPADGPADPPDDDRALVLRGRRDVLRHHAGARLPGRRVRDEPRRRRHDHLG